MKAILRHLIAVLTAIVISACASTKPSPSSSLSGSSWVGFTAKEETLNFEFRQGGKFGDFPGVGTWQQHGNTVTIKAKYGGGDVTYGGTINGHTMTGTARNAAGKTWSWRVNRRP